MDPNNLFPDVVICSNCICRTAREGDYLCSACRQGETRRLASQHKKVQKRLAHDRRQQKIVTACTLAQLAVIRSQQEEMNRDRDILRAARAQIRRLSASSGYYADSHGNLRGTRSPRGSRSASAPSRQQASNMEYWNWLFDNSPPTGLSSGENSPRVVTPVPPARPPAVVPPAQPSPSPSEQNPFASYPAIPSSDDDEDYVDVEDASEEPSVIDDEEEELSNNLSRSLSMEDFSRRAEPPASTDQSQDPCPICLMLLADGTELLQLQCSHNFHRVCIDRWIGHQLNTGTNGSCPCCRAAIS